MTAYLPGTNPDLWDPDPEERTHRFALGGTAKASTGHPPLVAVCMNPSYADRRQTDRTVNRLIQASHENHYAGWVMLNLYPERATRPSELSAFDPQLSAANCEAIAHVLGQFGVTEVLGAWGGLKHDSLRRAKVDVLDMLDQHGIQLFTFDGLTTGGDPLHPTPRGPALRMAGDKRYLARNGTRLFVVQ